MEKNKALKIVNILLKNYNPGFIALRFKNPFQLLVATILSAQCTDERVNKVIFGLFKKYKTINDFALAGISELEQDIKSTGFYRNKAKNIQRASQKILENFNGRVPNDMDSLLMLPGVGRKTANIVLSFGFGKNEGIAVDTHVLRISGRLGLTKNNIPDKVEQDLIKNFPKKYWAKLNSLLVQHGRKVCIARKPLCSKCFLREICPSFKKFYPGLWKKRI